MIYMDEKEVEKKIGELDERIKKLEEAVEKED